LKEQSLSLLRTERSSTLSYPKGRPQNNKKKDFHERKLDIGEEQEGAEGKSER
jgi:hypothetical protein